MIEKMKKLTALIYYKEYDGFLKQLQELGVVHIQTTQEGAAEPTSELQTKLAQTRHVRQWIDRFELKGIKPKGNTSQTAQDILAALDGMETKKQQLETEIQRLRKDEATLKPWGNFNPERVNSLPGIGYTMNFYACQQRAFNNDWIEQYNAIPISTDKGKIHFITLTPAGSAPSIDAEQIRLPQASLSSVSAAIAQKEGESREIESKKTETGQAGLNTLRNYEAALRTSIAFDQVALSTEHAAHDRLMVLQGWIPAPKENELKSFLDKYDVYYELREARKDDNAPIKLKNNAFVRMYEVLTKMYGMPGYAEFDPTPIIAPFFTLFFGFCMADAGYGLVLIALGFLLKHKMGKSWAGIMNLVITLGIATTIMGAILGTFFGISLVDADMPDWLKQFMVVGKIGDTSYDKQMLLALLIGVVHLCIAMTVKALSSTVRYGFKESLSAWGWLLLVVGSVCTFGLSFFQVISEHVTNVAFLVIASVSAVCIYLLNNLHRNVLLNIGAGLWSTYNMATGLLGDVLSYIRLYALGLAGAMLGGVFNQLALMARDGAFTPVDGAIYCGLILVFGHALNIAMSCLSAFVHPLRLTFVEYFKNSGFEGKGEAYNPFSIIKNDK